MKQQGFLKILWIRLVWPVCSHRTSIACTYRFGSGEREREGGPKLGRLENLLNHFDTIHLSNKKKLFKLGCARAGPGGGGSPCRHFLVSAEHRRSLQTLKLKKRTLRMFSIWISKMSCFGKSPVWGHLLLTFCYCYAVNFFSPLSRAADHFLKCFLSHSHLLSQTSFNNKF